MTNYAYSRSEESFTGKYADPSPSSCTYYAYRCSHGSPVPVTAFVTNAVTLVMVSAVIFDQETHCIKWAFKDLKKLVFSHWFCWF
jgi:hypothetical protein